MDRVGYQYFRSFFGKRGGSAARRADAYARLVHLDAGSGTAAGLKQPVNIVT